MQLDQDFWNNRYIEGTTGWDIGSISTPIKEYIDQLEDKGISILIPGAGNAYEAEYLFISGFSNISILDISDVALRNVQKRLPGLPQTCLLHGDFFLHQGKYDLIIEQTFFCAIDPILRSNYVTKTYELLKVGGKIVGVLWDVPLNDDHPPFGGSLEEYRERFKLNFKVNTLEKTYNSIPPRANREVFINFERA